MLERQIAAHIAWMAMTKAEIIAELRRSAREDSSPYWDITNDAFDATMDWRYRHESVANIDDGGRRTFFLLVACALEDEC